MDRRQQIADAFDHEDAPLPAPSRTPGVLGLECCAWCERRMMRADGVKIFGVWVHQPKCANALRDSMNQAEGRTR